MLLDKILKYNLCYFLITLLFDCINYEGKNECYGFQFNSSP